MAKETLTQLHDRALDFVLGTYAIYSNRTETEDKWIQADKLYNCLDAKKTYDGVANLFPPATRRAVRSLLNFCDEAVFSKNPNFTIKGIGGANDEKRAEINEKIIGVQLEKINFRTKSRMFLEKAIIKGTGIAKIQWKVKEKYIVKQKNDRKSLMSMLKNLMLGSVDTKELKTKIPIYDNVDFVPLELENVYWDFYTKWEDQEAVIEKINNVTNSSLRLLAQSDDSYFGIEEYLKENEIGIVAEDVTTKSPHTRDIVGTGDEMKVKKDRHELLECWCNFDIDNDGIDEECVITVIDKKKVIRCELNPYDIQEKPYVMFKWEDIDKCESLGQGAVSLAEKSQLALNDFTNQLMDDITMILDCMMVVDAQAGIAKSQMKSRPHGIITSNNGVDGIKFIRPPDVTNAALRAIAMTKDDIMEITGATANMQGLPARYDTTAKEAMLMQNSSQRDLFVKLRTFEDLVLKQMLRKMYSYNLQYLSVNDVKKLIGQEAFSAYLLDTGTDKVTDLSDVLIGDYDFIPLSVSQTENKIVKGQQFMNLYNMAIKSPAGIWNIPEIAKKIAYILNDGDLSICAKEIDSKLYSPQDENILMTQGESPFAKPEENHKEHIRIHSIVQLPESYQKIRLEHINEHIRFLQMQEQQQQNMIQQELLKQIIANNKGNAANNREPGVPAQEQPAFAPKGITEQQAGQVPNMVNPPATLG